MEKTDSIKTRNIGLDLLRIIAMLLIILLHSVDHSGVIEAAAGGTTAVYAYTKLVFALSKVCVNCFVMISGYFLVTSRFRLSKLAALWLETVFYSLVIRLIFIAAGAKAFSITSVVSCLFPVVTGRYWFITIYFGLYVVAPFLNIAVGAMNKRQHTALNVVLFLLFSVLSSIHPSIAGMNSGGGWGLAWFIVLYLAAAWFRLYYKPNGKAAFKLHLWVVISALIMLFDVITRGIPVLKAIAGNLYRYDSVAVYIATLCLFAAFLNININGNATSGIITKLSAATFGVYLIHAHADVSPWLWETLKLPEKLGKPVFPIIQFGCVLLIFAICAAADMIRNATAGRLERSSALRRLGDGISARAVKLFAEVVKGEK